MKVKFNYPRTIDGQHYSVGVHDVPESKKGNWFFDALINNGEAIILDIVDIIHKIEDVIVQSEEAPTDSDTKKQTEKSKKTKGK